MLKCLKKIDKAKTGIFAAGVLFGTAGIKVLSSKDAKKLYTNCTAAVLRAKECVMRLRPLSRRTQRISTQKLSRSTRTEQHRQQKSMMVKQKQQRLQQKNDPFMKAGINYEICDQA